MERAFIKDVEQFVIQYVRFCGGKTLTEYLGGKLNDGIKNADFYFEKEDVIIELKCLQKDIFSDMDFERNEKLIDKWLVNGTLRKVDLIPIMLGRKIIPDICIDEILHLTRNSFQTLLKKANKQLRVSKKEIGNEATKKVLMVCNDGNYFLSHGQIYHLICTLMLDQTNLDIDAFIYFTLNQSSQYDGDERDIHVWLQAYQDMEKDPQLVTFIDQLSKRYYQYCVDTLDIENSELTKIEDPHEGLNMIKKLTYIPKNEIYKE